MSPGLLDGEIELESFLRFGEVSLVRTEETRLQAKEREAIHAGLSCGKTGAEIARELGRDPSVINREIHRNGGRKGYSGVDAHARSGRRSRPPAGNKIAACAELQREVIELMERGATPKQIEVALRRRHPHDPARRVSHETIYQFVYVHSKGLLRKRLISLLRRKKPRRSPAPRAKARLSGQLPGAVNISERPVEAAGREVPGHWEADLIMGAGNRSACLVITERTSRYVMIVPLDDGKDATSVCRKLVSAFRRLPAHLRKSLTYDNGREMAEHLAFSIATDVAVYFCDPHSPWQRGGVENINGLIREYFPKGTDFATVTKRKIARAEWCLNNRPRIVLDGQTPSEVFHDAMNKNCALCA